MTAGQQDHTTTLGPPQPFTAPYSALPVRHSLDAHPLLREYFGAQLEERGSAPAAHARLFEYLSASVPYWPQGRDGLLPLYQAVAHGCKAGRYMGARSGVYRDRIKRGTAGNHAAYSTKKLGLYGLDLAAVASFFVEPWQRLAPQLTPDEQGWLLNETAVSLRTLNRHIEAREPMRAAMEMSVQQEHWKNAAIGAGNLSALEATLGDVPSAEGTAAQSVIFADRSGNAFQRMLNRTTHADALHQLGRLEPSRTLFAKAEKIQEERQPYYPLLYSLWGYRYCDVLLAAAERTAWRRCLGRLPAGSQNVSPGEPGGKVPPEPAADTAALLSDLANFERRATQTLDWATRHGGLLDVALDHLTLGRVQLLRAVLESTDAHLSSARTALDTALATLRQANSQHHIPRALLPCAWLHAFAAEGDPARQRLDEAYALATRGGNPQNGWQGGMRLQLADTLLHRARLFGWRNEYPWLGRTPAADLDEAEALIDACGYHRRDQELADARAALG